MLNNNFKSICILIGILLLNSAFAEDNCVANQYSIAQRPSMQMIRTINDFYHWQTFLNFNENAISAIPLAKRSNITEPSVLVGFDIDDRSWQYDFLSTRWCEGGCGSYQKTTEPREATQVYNFKFWQYLDISYYFGHGLLTIPPTMWTNAAHKNGVKSLGTFNLNEVDGSQLLVDNLQKTIDTLYDIAKAYGFEGYLINDEVFLENATPLLQLMEVLRKKGLIIIWYDAPISGGFANSLNKEALPFFTAAGYFHTNYWWGYPHSANLPAKSYQTLTEAHLKHYKNNVFQMGDVYRNPYKLDPFAQCFPAAQNGFFSRFNEITRYDHFHYTGLGFFAPNWTLFGGAADPVNDTYIATVDLFEQSDAAFWEGSGPLGCGQDRYENVSHFVEPRTVINQLPFYTNFNTGVGKKYVINGEVVSRGPWSNYSIQQILPTWQNVRLNNERPTAKSYFDYDEVFEGGSSWHVLDTEESESPVIFKLFKTDFSADQNKVILLLKGNNKIELVINQNWKVASAQLNFLKNNWRQIIFILPVKKQITEIDLKIFPDASNKINLIINSFKIEGQASLIPKNQIPQQKDFVLTWTVHHPGSLFRVFGRTSDNHYWLLNETPNNTYDLHGNIFNGNKDSSQFVSFLIQELTKEGRFIPISQ